MNVPAIPPQGCRYDHPGECSPNLYACTRCYKYACPFCHSRSNRMTGYNCCDEKLKTNTAIKGAAQPKQVIRNAP